MRRNEASDERERSLFSNLVVVVVFTSLILGFIVYFNDSSPSIRKVALQTLVEQFTKSTLNAHWQWQNEGRPSSILLVNYDAQGNETGRHPLNMSHLGWPRLAPDNWQQSGWNDYNGKSLLGWPIAENREKSGRPFKFLNICKNL